MSIHPEQTTDEFLNHLEWSQRRFTDLTADEYDELANKLARMAYDWNNDAEHCADWWGGNDIETILANAAVCVLRAKSAANDAQRCPYCGVFRELGDPCDPFCAPPEETA